MAGEGFGNWLLNIWKEQTSNTEKLMGNKEKNTITSDKAILGEIYFVLFLNTLCKDENHIWTNSIQYSRKLDLKQRNQSDRGM